MSDINQAILEVVNQVIASPAVQGIQFNTSSGCSKISIIDDIEFCDEISYSKSYEEKSISSACINACKDVKSAAYSTCDAARKACKSVCFGIKSCENGCDDISSDCKKAADAAYNACVSVCDYTVITGGVQFKVESVKGCGGLRVTSIDAVVPKDDTNKVFSVNMSLVIPSVTAYSHYKIWQDPMPALSGHENVYAKDVKGTATGTLIVVCSGDEKQEPGYYLTIDSLHIDVPQDVVDTAGLIAMAESIGLEVSLITNGLVNINDVLFSWVNGFLSAEIKSVLNDILDSTKIMDTDC